MAHHSIGTREHDGPVWSRDGSKMAFVMDGVMHVMPMTPTGEVPARRADLDDVADSPSWAADSRRLLYQTATGLKLVDVVDGRITDVPINLTWQPAIPARPHRRACRPHVRRHVADAPQRTWTSSFATTASSRSSSIAPTCTPAASIDAGNDVVMPGLIEMHAHLGKEYGEALGRIWLAYGITSVRNPAAKPYEGARG